MSDDKFANVNPDVLKMAKRLVYGFLVLKYAVIIGVIALIVKLVS